MHHAISKVISGIKRYKLLSCPYKENKQLPGQFKNLANLFGRHGLDCRTPQVRLKMIDKKPIVLLRGARSFFVARKMKKKIASLDFGDNSILPISNPDGQDREV